MRNHRAVAILFVAALALVLAPAAIAQQVSLQNSGLDEYTEDVPDAGGGEGPVGGDDGSGDGDSSNDGTTPSSGSTTDPTAVDSGTGTSTGTSAPTEEQVTSGSGTTPDGQLPATGRETLLLALSGAGLLALGLYLRKSAIS